jgi:hypothetical protein
MVRYFRYVDDTLIVLTAKLTYMTRSMNLITMSKFIIHHGNGIKQQNHGSYISLDTTKYGTSDIL